MLVRAGVLVHAFSRNARVSVYVRRAWRRAVSTVFLLLFFLLSLSPASRYERTLFLSCHLILARRAYRVSGLLLLGGVVLALLPASLHFCLFCRHFAAKLLLEACAVL